MKYKVAISTKQPSADCPSSIVARMMEFPGCNKAAASLEKSEPEEKFFSQGSASELTCQFLHSNCEGNIRGLLNLRTDAPAAGLVNFVWLNFCLDLSSLYGAYKRGVVAHSLVSIALGPCRQGLRQRLRPTTVSGDSSWIPNP